MDKYSILILILILIFSYFIFFKTKSNLDNIPIKNISQKKQKAIDSVNLSINNNTQLINQCNKFIDSVNKLSPPDPTLQLNAKNALISAKLGLDNAKQQLISLTK